MKTALITLLILTGSFVASSSVARSQGFWDVKTGGGTGADEAGRAIAIDSDGNSYVTGYFTGTATFSGTTLQSRGGYDIFIASYSPQLELRWVYRAGGVNDDFGSGMALDPRGGVYITGSCSDSSDFRDSVLVSNDFRKALVYLVSFRSDGTVRMAKGFGAYGGGTGLAVAPSGMVYMSGYFRGGVAFDAINLSASGTDAIFVASFDADGNTNWARSAGATTITGGSRRAHAVAIDKNENVFLTGWVAEGTEFGDTTLYAQGAANIFLASYSRTGAFRWLRSTGGANYDIGNGVVTDKVGNIYLTGFYQGPIHFLGTDSLKNENYLSNIFLAKFAPSGELTWVRSYGGAGSDEAYGIGVDSDGYPYITGKIVGPVTFEWKTERGYGGEDIFAARYSPNGDVLDVESQGGTGDDVSYAFIPFKYGGPYDWETHVTGSFQSTVIFHSFGSSDTIESAGGSDMFVGWYQVNSSGVDDKSSQTSVRITNRNGHLIIEGNTDRPLPATVHIVDLLGSTVTREQFIVEEGTWHYSLSIPSLPAGTYIVAVDMGNQRHHQIIHLPPRAL